MPIWVPREPAVGSASLVDVAVVDCRPDRHSTTVPPQSTRTPDWDLRLNPTKPASVKMASPLSPKFGTASVVPLPFQVEFRPNALYLARYLRIFLASFWENSTWRVNADASTEMRYEMPGRDRVDNQLSSWQDLGHFVCSPPHCFYF